MSLLHFRDPCVHCGIAMMKVPPGPCQGDPTKRVPMAYQTMGVRWDGVERFLIEMSDGSFIEHHSHISNHICYFDGWLSKARVDMKLIGERKA